MEELERIINTTAGKRIHVVLGDWNSNINKQLLVGTIEKFCLGKTSDSNIRLLQFEQSHRLIPACTLHPHKTPGQQVVKQTQATLCRNLCVSCVSFLFFYPRGVLVIVNTLNNDYRFISGIICVWGNYYRLVSLNINRSKHLR